MDKSDLHGQIEGVWRRLYVAIVLICLATPPAIIPWLKDMGIVSPDNRFFQWLWIVTPDLGQDSVVLDSVVSSSIIVGGALGFIIFGLLYFASKLKSLELLESFRDEAEKRLRVEGYMLKEREKIEAKK